MIKEMLLRGSRIAVFATVMVTSATLFAASSDQTAAVGGNAIGPINDNVGGDISHVDSGVTKTVFSGPSSADVQVSRAADSVQPIVDNTSADSGHFNSGVASTPVATSASSAGQVAAAGDGGNLVGPINDGDSGIHIDPNADAERDWANTGTDFNANASWTAGTGGVAPGTADVAYFTAAEVTQPNVSASATIAGLLFSTTTSNGYDITGNAGTALTLNGTSTTGSGGTSTSSAAAIRNNATSGTNTIDVPLVLASGSGTSTIFNAAGGTLVLNGAISETGGAKVLSLKNGTIQLNGNNSFSGGASIDASSTTLVIGNDNALGTGTFSINNTDTIQAGGGARTIANAVVFGGGTTISGSNAFTFNGAASSSGSNTRTVTVNNTGGVTFGGTFTLNGNTAPESFAFNGSSSVTLNGVVQDGAFGTSQLRNAGTGVLNINAVNTNTGGTQLTVAGGSIVVSAAGRLGPGNISLTAGGVTLTLQGATNMTSGSTLSYVSTDTINLNYAGSMTITGLTVDGVTEAPGIYGASGLNPDGAFFGVGTLTVLVPEPTTIGMLILGGGLLGAVQRFRRKQS